jgi:transcriptional regulator with XRE-family HTH domain
LSIGQLARLVEARPSQVLRWERDEHLPSGSALMRLAQVLDLAPADLFRLVGLPVPDNAASLPAMLRREYELPPEAIEEIQRNIERVAQKYKTRKQRTNERRGNHD